MSYMTIKVMIKYNLETFPQILKNRRLATKLLGELSEVLS